MVQEDRTLFLAARKGDVESYEKLIMPYQKKVFNLLLKLTGNTEHAIELAFMVFVRAYMSLERLKKEDLLPVFLYRIALETCGAEKGNQKRVVELDVQM